MLAAYLYLGRLPGLALVFGFLVLATGIDVIRLKTPAINAFFFKYFSRFIRECEKNKITGTPWYMLGLFLALLLFSTSVAVYAVAFLACGDVAATAVGEKWGSIKVYGVKSLQGTIGFFCVSVLVGLIISRCCSFGIGPAIYLTGAASAAVVELLPISINDNLTVPLVSGAVMQALVLLTS